MCASDGHGHAAIRKDMCSRGGEGEVWWASAPHGLQSRRTKDKCRGEGSGERGGGLSGCRASPSSRAECQSRRRRVLQRMPGAYGSGELAQLEWEVVVVVVGATEGG